MVSLMENCEIFLFSRSVWSKQKEFFFTLEKDSCVQILVDSTIGDVTLYARVDVLEVLEDEIKNVINYRYLCNEQMASKIIALLAQKRIALYRGEKFHQDKDIVKLIQNLKKNQKSSGKWGWWKDSDESDWISLHVIDALAQAEKSGFEVKLNKEEIIKKLVWDIENSRDFEKNVRIIRIFKLLNAQVNYGKYIAQLDSIENDEMLVRKNKSISLNRLLNIIELKQMCHLNYSLIALDFYQEKTLFGNIYFTDKSDGQSWLSSNIQNTLLAYRIIRNDTTAELSKLEKIRNYFLENRKTGNWNNTYESTQIIETILPDLLKTNTDFIKPSLIISGGVNKTITDFPFEFSFTSTKNIEVCKKGDFPMYITSYQKFWNTTPTEKKSDFEISTHFQDNVTHLSAGKETVFNCKTYCS